MRRARHTAADAHPEDLPSEDRNIETHGGAVINPDNHPDDPNNWPDPDECPDGDDCTAFEYAYSAYVTNWWRSAATEHIQRYHPERWSSTDPLLPLGADDRPVRAAPDDRPAQDPEPDKDVPTL